MIIIYQEYSADLYKFIRLDFETGEYEILYANFENANDYILAQLKLGYIFIHR